MAGTSTTNGGGLCLRPDPRVPRPTTTPRCISTPLFSADDDGVCVASHSAMHFLSPGCQFGAAGETAQVSALRHNGFRWK
jgi:hypothetical protein